MLTFQLPDAALVARTLSGDSDAFEALVLRHQRKAHAVARAHGVAAAAIEDVVQDAFLAAFRDLGTLRDAAKFGPWLVSIARSLARGYRRGREGRPGEVSGVDLDLLPAAAPSADCIEAGELRERVRRQVFSLPEGVREAIFLYYYEGRSTREVARALGTTRAAVKKRLQKGRDTLREELWRELESTLRDLLPSTREWRVKGRGLALVVLASTTASGRLTASGGTVSAGAGAGTAALSAGIFWGGLFMSAKKATFSVLAALLLLGIGGWMAVETLRPERREPLLVAPSAAAAPEAPAARPVAGAEQPPEAALEATPRPAFRVRVVDGEGEAVTDAIVKASWGQKDEKVMVRILSPGGFSTMLDGVGPGEFAAAAGKTEGDVVCLTAAAPSCVPRCEIHDLPPEGLADPIVMQLERCDTARLRLFDPNQGDRPVAGALVGPIMGNTWHSVFQSREEPRNGFPPSNFSARLEVPRLYEVPSDEQGAVSVGLRPDTLWVTREGYGPTAVRIYADHRPEASAVLPIPMYPPTTLRIAVRSAAGAALPGFAFGVDDGGFGPPSPNQRVEGAEVVHEIHHLVHLSPQPRLTKRLTVVVKAGSVEARTEVQLAYGEENPVDIVLEPVATALHGQVVDPRGSPIAGARVVAFTPTAGIRFLGEGEVEVPEERRANTGADGSYEITFATRPDPFYVLVRHAEHPFHVSEIVRLEANERRRHDVELPPAATITARFAAEAPEHPGGEVQLSNEGTPAHPLLTYTRTAQLDAEGAARFENVSPGPCTLNWSRGRGSSKLPLAVEAGKAYEVLLGEKEAGDLVDVVGSVVAGGAPVAGQRIRLYGADDRLSDIAETDEAGTFTFRDVSPGKRSMVLETFAGRPGGPHHFLQIEVEKGMAPLCLDVRAAAVSGRVVSDSGPLVGVAVRPYTVQYPSRVAGLAAFHSAQTAGDGSFRLPWLLQKPALLVFERDGYVTRRIEWRPRGALEDDLGDVRLEPHGGRGRVRFRVLGEAGEEVPRVLIDLHAVDLWAPLQVARIHRTGLNEDLSVEALPTGRYRAFARPGDLGAQEHTSEAVEFDHVAAADQEILVRTRRGGSVTLELRSGDGRVPCPAVVEVFDADGRAALTWRGEHSLVFTSSATLAGLPTGPLTARVTARGWKTLELPIEVVPGRVARIVAPIQRE